MVSTQWPEKLIAAEVGIGGSIYLDDFPTVSSPTDGVVTQVTVLDSTGQAFAEETLLSDFTAIDFGVLTGETDKDADPGSNSFLMEKPAGSDARSGDDRFHNFLWLFHRSEIADGADSGSRTVRVFKLEKIEESEASQSGQSTVKLTYTAVTPSSAATNGEPTPSPTPTPTATPPSEPPPPTPTATPAPTPGPVLTFVEVQKDGVGSADGLLSAQSVTVSPDGEHLYAAACAAEALAVFSRNSTTGALTFVEVQKDGVGGVDGLHLARSVMVSPDGKHLYVAGTFDRAVAVFSRNPTTGALTFVEVQKDGVGGVDGLREIEAVTVSPDGKHLYTAASGGVDAVTVFSRNSATGSDTHARLR